MPKLGKTTLCITCTQRQPAKGRVCDKCRYAARKESGETKTYYIANRTRISKRGKQYSKNKQKHRRDALQYYGAKCFYCSWDKAETVLHVHHKDSNRSNG